LNLSNLELRKSYNSNENNLVDDFYIRCLNNSIEYKRAVGYFTSNSLAIAAKGLFAFLENNGRMKLIASPILSKEDIKAIKKGYENRGEIIEKNLIKEIDNISNDVVSKRYEFLAWLISKEILDIKLAVLSGKNHYEGIYHEKLGIFSDPKDNIVAFTGSPNETMGGMYSNYESIDVFKSWIQYENERAIEKNNYFNKLWNNNIENLDIIEFPEIAKSILAENYKTDHKPMYDPESNYSKEQIREFILSEDIKRNREFSIPEYIELRDYQKKAIKKWFKNDGKGILRMATGTGKTITALGAAKKTSDVLEGKIFIVIVCPYTHLVDQWKGEMKKFNLNPILAYSNKSKWLNKLNSEIISLKRGAKNILALITTTRTFINEDMQASINKLKRYNNLLIADEVHYLGAPKTKESLPENYFDYKLGLSATPYRWRDDEGTQELFNYFGGGVIFNYDLDKAIKNGYLTKYYYYPIITELNEEESEEYLNLSNKIGKLFAMKSQDKDDFDYTSTPLKKLLIERARIVNSAKNKLDKLKNIVRNNYPSKHNLFYCGDGKVDGEKQIDKVVKVLGRDIGMKVHKFTAQEDNIERKKLLKKFDSKKIEGLVAIRCLDEGVDVPATKNAYILASSTNPREFIQRRGRILRPHDSKHSACIYDFLVIPGESVMHLSNDETFNTERKLVKRELKRVSHFAESAENGPEALRELSTIKNYYNLRHI